MVQQIEELIKKYLYYYDSIERHDIISNILAEYNIEENVFTKELIDEHNILELKNLLKEYYLLKNKIFVDELDLNDLKNRLNSFKQDLPKKFVKNNNTLKNLFALKKFFEYKTKRKIQVSNLLIFKSLVLDKKIRLNFKNIIFKITPIFIIKTIRRKKEKSYNF